MPTYFKLHDYVDVRIVKELKDIKCGECQEVLASVGDANYEGLDPANAMCYVCAVK